MLGHFMKFNTGLAKLWEFRPV